MRPIERISLAASRERESSPKTVQTARAVRHPAVVDSVAVLAEVIDSASGGGYYNCKLQVFDATYWNTNTDPLSDTGDSIIVLNLAERGTINHHLSAGDLIRCGMITDDEGNARYVGQETISLYRCTP